MEKCYDEAIASQESKRLASAPLNGQLFTSKSLPNGLELIEMSFKYDR